MGRERRTLNLEHEAEWTGRGVSYCSVCDAPLHRGNTVAVVGGGDSAVKGATLLSKYAERVYVIYRREAFTRPEPVNLRRLEEASNVETIFSANVTELRGSDGLEGIVIDPRVQREEPTRRTRHLHRDRRRPQGGPRQAARCEPERPRRDHRG